MIKVGQTYKYIGTKDLFEMKIVTISGAYVDCVCTKPNSNTSWDRVGVAYTLSKGSISDWFILVKNKKNHLPTWL